MGPLWDIPHWGHPIPTLGHPSLRWAPSEDVGPAEDAAAWAAGAQSPGASRGGGRSGLRPGPFAGGEAISRIASMGGEYASPNGFYATLASVATLG